MDDFTRKAMAAALDIHSVPTVHAQRVDTPNTQINLVRKYSEDEFDNMSMSDYINMRNNEQRKY